MAASAACARKPPPPPGDAPSVPSASAQAASAPPPLVPPSTTSPEIALSNLDVQITGREQALGRREDDVDAARTLVQLLLARAEYASRIKDMEHADQVAKAIAKRRPESAEARIAYASTLAAFHLFAQAEAELAEAEKADSLTRSRPLARAVRDARSTILMAQGRFDDAAALRPEAADPSLGPMELATLATLAGERDRPEEAEQLFDRARAAYRDVTPFPVAWIDFQRGSYLEKRGDRIRAKQFLAEAHTLLPSYAHPVVHLAALDAAQALALLEPLLRTSDDPQVDAAYGDALRRAGRTEEARTANDRARQRYDALVTAHPEAFADHAAAFYLDTVRDPTRALPLARRNAQLRRTEPALDLLILAAHAAGAKDEACAAARDGAALKYASSAFRATVAAVQKSCPP